MIYNLIVVGWNAFLYFVYAYNTTSMMGIAGYQMNSITYLWQYIMSTELLRLRKLKLSIFPAPYMRETLRFLLIYICLITNLVGFMRYINIYDIIKYLQKQVPGIRSDTIPQEKHILLSIGISITRMAKFEFSVL